MKAQPQDPRSEVFVYGRPHPDGSGELPLISIINFEDHLGRTFLLPKDENGSDHVQYLDHTPASGEKQLRFDSTLVEIN